mgnify:CR=1 FL=1
MFTPGVFSWAWFAHFLVAVWVLRLCWWMLLLWMLLVAFPVSVVLSVLRQWWSLRHIPANPRASFLLGDIPYMKDFQAHHQKFHPQYGPILLRRFGHVFVVSLGHPDYYTPVLQRYSNFTKGAYWQFIKPIMGTGLPMSEGQEWQRTRKLLNPPFSDASLGAIVPKIEPIARNLVRKFQEGVDSQKVFNVEHEFMAFTYDVIMATTFSENPNTIFDSSNPIPMELDEALRIAHEMGSNPLHPARFFPTPSWRLLKTKARRVFEHMHEKVMKRMKETPAEAEKRSVDILDMMIAAADDAGNVDPVLLSDQAVSFVIGGQDTSSISLSWAVYYLSTKPEVYASVMEEVERLYHPDEPLTSEKLQEYAYLEAFIKEVARHKPPSLAILRTVAEDVVIKGYKIPKGTQMSIPVNACNFHPDLWGEDTLEFRPERFLDSEFLKQQPHFSMMTFSGGPRRCIGEKFSMLEQKIVLLALLYELRPISHDRKEPFSVPAFTLKTVDGVHISFARRRP